MARMNEVKLKFAGNGTDEFSTPTLEELPIEYQQIYEALKKKREEEFERLKKQHEENGFQEFIKLFPPSNNHVGPSVMLGQDKKGTLQANQQEKIDSANTVESVKANTYVNTSSTAESCNTCGESDKKKDHTGDAIDSIEAEPNSSGDSKSVVHTESIEPIEEKFIDGLPYEFRVKDDKHQSYNEKPMVAELQLIRLENQDERAAAKSGLFDTTQKHIPSCSPLSELQNTIQVTDFSETIAELLVARIYVSDDDQLRNKRRVSANSEET